MLLPGLNSCVNPWIYLLLNHNLLYTLLKLLFGTKCIDNTDSKYPNETTNQRLSISMHRATNLLPTDGSTTNSPTTINTNNSLVTPVHLINSSPSSSLDNIIRKNRLKRITSSQSMKSDQMKREINNNESVDTMSDKINFDKNRNLNLKEINNRLSNLSSNKNKNKTETTRIDRTKIETVASLTLSNGLNKIDVKKCTDLQINKFNLPRFPSESSSNTHTKDQQIIYQTSSSAPDLKFSE